MEPPFNTNSLDPVIHGRMRLGMMAYLASISGASFAELKSKLEASDGNLSTHLRKLEDAGYVKVEKSFNGRKPHTSVKLTQDGRDAWIKYLDHMQGLLSGA